MPFWIYITVNFFKKTFAHLLMCVLRIVSTLKKKSYYYYFLNHPYIPSNMNCKCSENKGPSPLKIVVPCPLYQAQQ